MAARRRKIGVDFDATTSHYDGWQGVYITGRPIARMIERIRQWRHEGHEVYIFTARIVPLTPENFATSDYEDVAVGVIREWCMRHLGFLLPVTHSKGGLDEMWDDRAVQVIPNTGETVLEAALRIIDEEIQDAGVNGESTASGWLVTARNRIAELGKIR